MSKGVRTWSGAALLLVALAGCGKPPPPPPPPAPPPPPPVPQAVNVDAVLASTRLDPRVQFPQEAAPLDESLVVAVAQLANALVAGDDAGMRTRLAPDAQRVLDALVSSGEWEDSTQRVQGVRVLMIVDNAPTGTQEMNDATFYLGVQEAGQAYVLGWSGTKTDGAWVFNGSGSTSAVRARASDFAEFTQGQLEGSEAAPGGGATAGVAGAGGGVSGGMGLPPGMMQMLQAGIANITDEDAAMLYAMFEVQGALGDASALAGMRGTVQPALDKGKAAVDRGVLPAGASLREMLAPLASQHAKSEDEVINALAGVLKVTAQRLREHMGMGGGGDGGAGGGGAGPRGG